MGSKYPPILKSNRRDRWWSNTIASSLQNTCIYARCIHFPLVGSQPQDLHPARDHK